MEYLSLIDNLKSSARGKSPSLYAFLNKLDSDTVLTKENKQAIYSLADQFCNQRLNAKRFATSVREIIDAQQFVHLDYITHLSQRLTSFILGGIVGTVTLNRVGYLSLISTSTISLLSLVFVKFGFLADALKDYSSDLRCLLYLIEKEAPRAVLTIINPKDIPSSSPGSPMLFSIPKHQLPKQSTWEIVELIQSTPTS